MGNCYDPGWGLNEQEEDFKRDLKNLPIKTVITVTIRIRYGEIRRGCLRYWAAGSRLSQDLRFHEKDVAGRKIVVKLWNVARFCTMQLEGYDPTVQRPEISNVQLRMLSYPN